jgi:hypothetical protein
MSECATDLNKGMFNSVFWIFNMGSLVIGNIMATFVLKYLGSESTLYYILTAINGLAVLWFIFLPVPIELASADIYATKKSLARSRITLGKIAVEDGMSDE